MTQGLKTHSLLTYKIQHACFVRKPVWNKIWILVIKQRVSVIQRVITDPIHSCSAKSSSLNPNCSTKSLVIFCCWYSTNAWINTVQIHHTYCSPLTISDEPAVICSITQTNFLAQPTALPSLLLNYLFWKKDRLFGNKLAQRLQRSRSQHNHINKRT